MIRFLREAYHDFAVHNPARHGAALAYYGMFSLIPILAIGSQLAGALLSVEAREVIAEFEGRMAAIVGEAVVHAYKEQVAEAALRPEAGPFVITGISILVILYTASGAFAQLKYSLNTLWGVPHETQLRTRPMIATRLMGMGLVLGVGVLLVVAIAAYVIVGSLSTRLGLAGFLPILNALVAVVLITFSFAVLYKILPDARVPWRSAWHGAILAAVVAMGGLAIVTLYFRFVRLNTALSVAGGVAVVLIGINYLAQIFLFGAVLCRKIGSQEDAATSGPVS